MPYTPELKELIKKVEATRAERVEQLLAITRAPVNRSFSTDRPLGEYGLAPPLAVLQVNALRIGFGARDNAQRQRYALLDGRVQKRGYGRRFLAALPAAPVVRQLAEVETFFDGFPKT